MPVTDVDSYWVDGDLCFQIKTATSAVKFYDYQGNLLLQIGPALVSGAVSGYSGISGYTGASGYSGISGYSGA